MKLLYVSKFMFLKKGNETFALPSCSDSFFQKYLDTFDSVEVLGEEVKSFLDHSKLVKMEDKHISVKILPQNATPKDFLNDKQIKKILFEEIQKAEAILIKPSSRKGIMACKIAEKLNKPYMIELTGDIHNALLQNPSRLKRFYAPILYKKIKRGIRNCKYALYVSQTYLQNKYPISGKMFGCADVVLNDFDDEILQLRFDKIEKMSLEKRIDMGLIGFYQGNGKGVDTAIRALARLPKNFHLSVLGNGTKENRDFWMGYAEKYGVREQLHFCEPLPNVKEVLLWLDNMDFFVLPTRSEGLCRCVVEAMSRGCPCFVTDICTMPELLPKECLHKLDDDEKLSGLVINAVNDKDALKRMAKRNFEKAQEYKFETLKERRNAFLAEFKEYCEKINVGES